MIADDGCGAIGGMQIGRGNRSTRRKPAPEPLCPLQIPHDLNLRILNKNIETGPDKAHIIVKIICFLLNIIINKDNVNESILQSEGVHRVNRSVADKFISNFWFMTGF
jgi:hypothetical protein